MDIDREIELAKRKPLTSETLNYIGDLCLKKGDKQRAVAYYFEAVDKLHFAQKEKKMAICKKIIKISPNSERAYEGIIEVLSKMGLVIEEKKYLHTLARICEEKGDRDKAEELYAKIKELDPHVSLPGTFFYRSQDEVPAREPSADQTASDKLPTRQGEEELTSEDSGGAADRADKQTTDILPVNEEKLIEASLEEVSEEIPFLSRGHELKKYVPKKHIFIAASACILAVVLIFVAVQGRRSVDPSVNLPFSAAFDNIEVHAEFVKDMSEISSIVSSDAARGMSFIAFSLKSVDGCMPDTFASLSPGMISLLDQRGSATEIKTVEGLQKLSKIIYKSNVCGKENGVVFVRVIIPVLRNTSYSGIALRIPEKNEPILLKWNVQ
ncbi:MAG: tetratricopeptide repeat protein [Nitrospirae bacterium]|nr:tetratricopeptide repeat protein [Nitrospirota bacterium]